MDVLSEFTKESVIRKWGMVKNCLKRAKTAIGTFSCKMAQFYDLEMLNGEW